jgi:hypothetical protein
MVVVSFQESKRDRFSDVEFDSDELREPVLSSLSRVNAGWWWSET